MVNLKKFDKNEIGKLLMPEKIFNLRFKKVYSSLYEKLHYDKINYSQIANVYALSVILTMIIFVFAYPFIYQYLYSYLTQNIFMKYGIFVGIWFLINITLHYTLLLLLFFYNDSKFKKNEMEIERDLPDFIDSLVSNIKGGISLEKAILESVRKDQRVLLREVTLINEKIMMGKGVIESIKQFRTRFDSAIINRTFFLVEEGLKGGGNLAEPLERISENLKRIYALDEEIKSSSSGFTTVITFISVIVSPLLFALAIALLYFISDLFELLNDAETEVIGQIQMPEEFTFYLSIFSYAMIVLITFFSSLIVSHLKGEKTFKMIKYLPIYILISVLVYNFLSNLLLSYFGNIL